MNWLDVGTGVRTGTSQVGSHRIPPDRTFPKQPHSRADFQAHWQLRQVPGKLWTQQMSVNHLCEVLFFRSDMLLCPLAWGQQDLSPPPLCSHRAHNPSTICGLQASSPASFHWASSDTRKGRVDTASCWRLGECGTGCQSVQLPSPLPGYPQGCLRIASVQWDPLATTMENISLNFLTSVYLNTPDTVVSVLPLDLLSLD